MPKITKRELFGYAPISVQQAIDAIRAQHQERLRSLEEKSASLAKETENLQAEIDQWNECLLQGKATEQAADVPQQIEQLKRIARKYRQVLENTSRLREENTRKLLEQLRVIESLISGYEGGGRRE